MSTTQGPHDRISSEEISSQVGSQRPSDLRQRLPFEPEHCVRCGIYSNRAAVRDDGLCVVCCGLIESRSPDLI